MKTEFKIISDLIDKNSHVLDVGCGDGILMEFLIKEKKVNIRGIEISKAKVQNCIAKGLTIIEGNAEDDLRQFPNKSFDYVILSQTLQAFLNPEKVIDELLRIGKQAIVTIPNFGISNRIAQKEICNFQIRHLENKSLKHDAADQRISRITVTIWDHGFDGSVGSGDATPSNRLER